MDFILSAWRGEADRSGWVQGTESQKWGNDPRQVQRTWADQLRPRQGVDGYRGRLGDTGQGTDRGQTGDSATGGQGKELVGFLFTQ